MRVAATFALLTGTLLLSACASSLPKPEEYGFRRVDIKGQEYFCAPTQWVVPSFAPAMQVVAADASGDVPSGLFGVAYPNVREVCLTQAQWPKWLMLRNRLSRQWPITPHAAAALANK